jgi:DegV family protein with EDD domain
MPYSYVSGRDIQVLFYSYMVDGEEYVDDMGRDPQALGNFYKFIDQGKQPSTSQITTYCYCEYFRTLLEKGDVLHIAFGSGMTPSVHNAREAAAQLREEFPDRKLVVVDSLCSSSGYGLLVDYAADMRDSGCTMEQIEKWLVENCEKVQHQFFSTDLKYFRRSGRVSGPAATVASVLDICPLMRLDKSGHIIAYSKVRGKKKALRATVDVMLQHAQGQREYSGKCFISHSNCLEQAMELKNVIEQEFPNLSGKVRIFDIGTIIASHCGPGTTALYFFGDERPE